MADISEFSLVTYERRPGCWRAAVTRNGSVGKVVGGDMVRSVVTPDLTRPSLTLSLQPKSLSENFS
jgi:hypothetical protein